MRLWGPAQSVADPHSFMHPGHNAEYEKKLHVLTLNVKCRDICTITGINERQWH